MKANFEYLYWKTNPILTSLLTIRKDTKETNLFFVYESSLILSYIMFLMHYRLSIFCFAWCSLMSLMFLGCFLWCPWFFWCLFVHVRSKHWLLKWKAIKPILKDLFKYTLHSRQSEARSFFHVQQCNLMYWWRKLSTWKASSLIEWKLLLTKESWLMCFVICHTLVSTRMPQLYIHITWIMFL